MATLFFDLDGTLLDTQAGIADSIRFALSELNSLEVTDEQLKQCFGPPLRHSFTRLLNSNEPAMIAEAVAIFRQHYLNDGIFNYKVYEGVLPLLGQLSDKQITNRVSLRILTAKPQQQAEWLLDHSNLAGFFNGIHGSEDSGIKSDKSSHLRSILNNGSATIKNCWVIGDRASDILAAKENEVSSVAVHWGYGDAQELSEAGSDHHISSPEELLALLAL